MEGPNLRILVVEDHKLLSWSLSRLLAEWGFQADSVFTGSEAVDQSRRAGYDMVLLDYQLPDVDGLEVARSLREAFPGVVIILMTALERDELTVPEGLIDVYFNKPVAFEVLRSVIVRYDRVLRSRGPGGIRTTCGSSEKQ